MDDFRPDAPALAVQELDHFTNPRAKRLYQMPRLLPFNRRLGTEFDGFRVEAAVHERKSCLPAGTIE
jgi:hypothetical protein